MKPDERKQKVRELRKLVRALDKDFSVNWYDGIISIDYQYNVKCKMDAESRQSLKTLAKAFSNRRYVPIFRDVEKGLYFYYEDKMTLVKRWVLLNQAKLTQWAGKLVNDASIKQSTSTDGRTLFLIIGEGFELQFNLTTFWFDCDRPEKVYDWVCSIEGGSLIAA